MVLYSPDWTNSGVSFILLAVNLFRHPTLIEHGLYHFHTLEAAYQADAVFRLLSPRFFKKAKGILQSPPSVCLSVRPSVCPSVRPSVRLSVMLSPKPLDEIQPNLVCELLT